MVKNYKTLTQVQTQINLKYKQRIGGELAIVAIGQSGNFLRKLDKGSALAWIQMKTQKDPIEKSHKIRRAIVESQEDSDMAEESVMCREIMYKY